MDLKERKEALRKHWIYRRSLVKKNLEIFLFWIWCDEIWKRFTKVSWNVSKNYTLL